jgi:hypothetical protein
MYCKLYKFGKNLPSNMPALWASKPSDLFLYAVPVFENYPKSDLIQNRLKPASLGTDWI